jgi:hypothetical protein
LLLCSVTSHKTVCPTCHVITFPQCHIFCVRHQQGMKVSLFLAWLFVDDEFAFSPRLISPSNSPPILSCTTTCHVGVFLTCHIFLCPHRHIFLCRSHCYNLTIELTAHFVMHHNLLKLNAHFDAPQLATLACFRHATFFCVLIDTFFCVLVLVTGHSF